MGILPIARAPVVHLELAGVHHLDHIQHKVNHVVFGQPVLQGRPFELLRAGGSSIDVFLSTFTNLADIPVG